MLAISSQDIIRRLRLENPWWEGSHAISKAHSGMKPRAYLDLFLPLVKHPVRRAVVLMGPRRVGKTVMIHHAIQALLAERVPAHSVCYLSVDSPIYNGLRIEQLLEYYRQAIPQAEPQGTSYVFFDEIQYMRSWEVQLKNVVDTQAYVKFVASGSAAAALRLKTEESGAGRFTDFLLPPLTFFEYLNLLGKTDLMRAPAFGPARGTPRHARGYFEALDIEAVNRQFLNYLNFGGYPEVIFSEQIQSDPARYIKSDIIDKVLLRDLPSLYGIEDIQELNYLFTTLAFNTASEISLGGLSQNSGLAKNTIKRYIDYLEAAFLIKIVHRVDHTSKRFKRANFFKIYLTNPSMRAALFSPVQENDDATGHLAETSIFSQWFYSDDITLHYARWNDGEVDMVSVGPDQRPMWAVEVKWSDRYCDKPEELSSLLDFMQTNELKDVLVTSKTKTMSCTIRGKRVRFIPASVYCYTVGFNLVHGRKNLSLSQQLEVETPTE